MGVRIRARRGGRDAGPARQAEAGAGRISPGDLMRLSVIVITKNEERAIARCLESVRFADELVVVDSGSTDHTVEICKRLGARMEVTQDWPGFGPQKNRALALATGDWVLSVDADEWVSPALADEIRRVTGASGGADAYALSRLSSFCGRFMRHSGWWPDRVVRLFRRGAARFSDDAVHERLLATGVIGRLDGVLYHEALSDLEEALAKMNQYTSSGAQMMIERGASGSLLAAVARGLWAFVRVYLLRAGFLDGREGFMLAVSTAESAYYRQAKAMLLSRSRTSQPRK
jgi:glycosyltransferase involved in cell wall biosynthesis